MKKLAPALLVVFATLFLISTSAWAMGGKPAKPQTAAYNQCLADQFNYCYGAANEKYGSPYYKTAEGNAFFASCVKEKDQLCLGL